MTFILLILFMIMNVAGLMIMNIDKNRAINHQYRISERTLWLVALFGGAIGAFLGMNLFRHKTKHLSFKLGFPLLAVAEALMYIYLLIWS